MQTHIYPGAQEAASNAAMKGASLIKSAIAARGEAFIVLATGASQFTLLEQLVADTGIDWPRVSVFHLDEYVGIDETHPASFVRYLRERFLAKVPGVKDIVFIHGNQGDVRAEIERVNHAISGVQIDVAFVGIGENGHLAFNDPPADFETEMPFIAVELDEKCRWQQTNEGWFATFDDVPTHAISMSVRQIMKSTAIICTVLDDRKAEAAKWTIEGEVSNLHPASILQTHENAFIFLDRSAAAQLSSEQG
ncbi:MAG TPA: glucosamine-6-phosphate deaminase [Devosia sp.]|nr:glucosamine-6-phosphate deaminase [Devosia sp.]